MNLAPEVSALLGTFQVIEVPIWWGDQDAFGHVNNTLPLRWFESARIAYAERIGLTAMFASERIGPILASIRCDYRRQLHYPDTVFVGARVSRIGRTSLTMDHLAVSRSLGQVAVEGSSTLVVFDYKTQSPTPVPDAIRKAIIALEGGDIPGGSGTMSA